MLESRQFSAAPPHVRVGSRAENREVCCVVWCQRLGGARSKLLYASADRWAGPSIPPLELDPTSRFQLPLLNNISTPYSSPRVYPSRPSCPIAPGMTGLTPIVGLGGCCHRHRGTKVTRDPVAPLQSFYSLFIDRILKTQETRVSIDEHQT